MGKANPKDKNKIGAMTDQMRAFAREYVIDHNAQAAAIRAGYAESNAASKGCHLLDRPDVRELVEKHMARAEANSGIKAERVLQEAWCILTADVNDLVEFRRRCCRHCYGIDFGYQRTVSEISRERAEYEREKRKAIAKDPNVAGVYEDFDEKGGPGYDARRPPNPDCTECWGDGVGDAHFKATANLTPAARALYAGVKQTKEGFQMLTIDKMAAMEKLFKHLNLYEKEIKTQTNPLTELLAAVAANGSKLPIKPQ